jgi:hypothetical protein
VRVLQVVVGWIGGAIGCSGWTRCGGVYVCWGGGGGGKGGRQGPGAGECVYVFVCRGVGGLCGRVGARGMEE